MVPANQGPPEKQQPKRILGLMPNFRAVSAGAIPTAYTEGGLHRRDPEQLRLLVIYFRGHHFIHG